MTISDIFKNDFLTQTTGDLTVLEIMLTLGLALVLGLVIFQVYKYTFQGVMYSKTFNVSLVALSLISATIIVGVTNNIVLSLGMVGALSIVRFRTSIKDPMDVIYMFWAIGIGIIAGAGLIVLAIVSTVFIGGVLLFFSKTDIQNDPYLVIVNYSEVSAEDDIYTTIDQYAKKQKMKSKTSTPRNMELTIEVRLKSDRSQLVNELDKIESVTNVAMVSYDGEYAA